MRLIPKALRAVSSALHPSCPACGMGMHLVLIESVTAGHDKRSFECLGCEHFATTIVDFGRAQPTARVGLLARLQAMMNTGAEFERADKHASRARTLHDPMVLQQGLRAAFPPCHEAIPTQMEGLLAQLRDSAEAPT